MPNISAKKIFLKMKDMGHYRVHRQAAHAPYNGSLIKLLYTMTVLYKRLLL